MKVGYRICFSCSPVCSCIQLHSIEPPTRNAYCEQDWDLIVTPTFGGQAVLSSECDFLIYAVPRYRDPFWAEPTDRLTGTHQRTRVDDNYKCPAVRVRSDILIYLVGSRVAPAAERNCMTYFSQRLPKMRAPILFWVAFSPWAHVVPRWKRFWINYCRGI